MSAAPSWPPSPPPASPNFNGLGLSGQATINSKSYFKANIEGYNDISAPSPQFPPPSPPLPDAPKGPQTEWVPNSKPIVFTEYGFPACDKCTNQPNVFFDAKSTESATPFWSIWQPSEGGGFLPKPDQNLSLLALQAIYEYWFVGRPQRDLECWRQMIEPAFCSVWNWDARPFPAFPNLVNV